MRIPRQLYDTLKRIQANDGSTHEISMGDIEAVIHKGLAKEAPRNNQEYRLAITPKGMTALTDRPIDL